jgi:hypothetical protein
VHEPVAETAAGLQACHVPLGCAIGPEDAAVRTDDHDHVVNGVEGLLPLASGCCERLVRLDRAPAGRPRARGSRDGPVAGRTHLGGRSAEGASLFEQLGLAVASLTHGPSLAAAGVPAFGSCVPVRLGAARPRGRCGQALPAAPKRNEISRRRRCMHRPRAGACGGCEWGCARCAEAAWPLENRAGLEAPKRRLACRTRKPPSAPRDGRRTSPSGAPENATTTAPRKQHVRPAGFRAVPAPPRVRPRRQSILNACSSL